MPFPKGKKIDPGQRVVIVHNGTEAIDLGRQCRDMGAQQVTIISNRELHELPVELQDAKGLAAEGIFVRHSALVSGLKGISERLVRVVLEDSHPKGEIPGKEEAIRADTLIFSEGRLPEILFVRSDDPSELQPEEVSWETVESFRTFPGSKDGMFSPPEPGRISDSSAVVKSLLSGRRLTRAVHEYFTDHAITPIQNLACEADSILNVAEVHEVISADREVPDIIDVEGNSKTAWIFPDEFPRFG